MKIPALNPFYRAALVLLGAAVVLILVAVITPEKGLTSAALVIAGVSCMVTGIFLAALSGPEPVNTRLISLLPVQGAISLSRICADLGISENAHFLPPAKSRNGRIMQFNPVAPFDGDDASIHGDSFVIPPGPAGLLVMPSSAPLIQELRASHGLVVPADASALPDLIREAGVELMETADRMSVEVSGTTITVRMEGYRLIDGCRAVQGESPRCCLVSPCPVCSLFACLITEGTGQVVRLEHCSPDATGASVTLVFSLLLPGSSA
ncbi:MAG TPA: hypothetical protein HA272_03995 [Methanoregula sp.]|nr:hypothetical protein [Methanoregula sp.]